MLSSKSLHAPNLIDHEIISVAIKKTEAKAGRVVARGLDGFRKLRLARVALNAPLATYDRVLAAAAKKVLALR